MNMNPQNTSIIGNASETADTTDTTDAGSTVDAGGNRHVGALGRPGGERAEPSLRDAAGGIAQAHRIAFRDSGTEDKALGDVAILGYN